MRVGIAIVRGRLFLYALLLSVAFGLASCGGDGSSSSSTPTPTATAISAQPASVSAVAGAGATFSVVAVGDGLTYQWQRSTDAGVTFTAIAGATASTYSLATVDVSLNGFQYRVVITGSSGVVTSSAVTLTVMAAVVAPAITTQPLAQSVVAGVTASFSVTATGTSITYQWQTSADGVTFTNISGATNATLTLTGLTTADSGRRIRVVITNSASSVTSSAVTLTVTPAPSAAAITTQPASVSVVAPATATFTVVAVGLPAPTYQWQVSSDNGSTFNDIAGATAASYTTAATFSTDNGKMFRVRISNPTATVVSSSALLTVTATGAAPAIALQPNDELVLTPYPGVFSVSASGTPFPTYQWQQSTDGGTTFANINGATSPTYTTPPTAAAAAGSLVQFRVVLTNVVASIVSHPATMKIVDSGIGGYVNGLAMDSSGNIYADVTPGGTHLPDSRADFYGVKKLDTSGVVTSLAGSAIQGYTNGTGASATFYSPNGLAVDSNGNVYVVDSGVNEIRKVTPTGVTTVFAGGDIQGGFVNGTGTQASFYIPLSVAIDGSGNLYVTDKNNSAIRKITPAAAVTTFAGGTAGTADGTGTAAKFYIPTGISSDSAGNLAVTDAYSVRTINPQGVVVTRATYNTPGMFTDPNYALAYVNGNFSSAILGCAWDSVGNIYVLVIDSSTGYSVRKVTPSGTVSTVTGATNLRSGSNSMVVDSAGNLYVGDTFGYSAGLPDSVVPARPFTIRKITANGVVTEIP